MREFVREFCRMSEETLDLKAPVVEIGSYQVVGQEGFSDLRPIFGGKQYIGCDMRPGIGVDRIESLPKLSFASGSIPTIVCLDPLEHIFEIGASIAEIHRVLSSKGVFVVSSVFNSQFIAIPMISGDLPSNASRARWIFFHINSWPPKEPRRHRTRSMGSALKDAVPKK